MKFHRMLVPALLLSLFLTACGGPASQETAAPSPEEAQTSSTAQPGILSQFSAQDLEGTPVTQDILKGHALTMVNVWATFCTPCIGEMPGLGELAQEYAQQGVQIVGMVSDALASDGSIDPDQLALAQDIVESTSAHYTHIVPQENLYGLLYQITSVPTTFFVDETGKQVGTAYLGSKSKDQWAKIIDQMLAEVAP